MVDDSLEARLGTRVSIWVGALALALSGAFLVKYAFDRDLLGPAVRVGLGIAFGGGLVGLGEWSRGRRAGRIGEGLVAAGAAVLYASFYAATEAYHFVSPVAGFVLLALTTALAVGLSLRHGPLVAVIGLVGGFLTPGLVGSDAPASPIPLFGYLLLLQAGLAATARRRGWWPLGAVALLFSLVWVFAWLGGAFEAADAVVLYVFVGAATATLVAVGPARLDAADRGEWALLYRIAHHALLGFALTAAAAVVSAAGLRPLDWLCFGLLGAATFVLARRDAMYANGPWIAAALTALLLESWYSGQLDATGASRAPFLIATAALGALYALGGYALVWRAPKPARWAALAALVTVVYFLIATEYWVDAGARRTAAGVALGLAAGLAALAAPIAARRGTHREGDMTLAALVVGALALVTLAVPLGLRGTWVTATWAIEVPAALWIARQLRIGALRALAWPLAALVALRLTASSLAMNLAAGQPPIINELMVAYGVPIAAFVSAARRAKGDGDDRLAPALGGLAVVFGLALITLEVRHAFHPADPRSGRLVPAENAAYSLAWVLYGLGLLAVGVATGSRLARYASLGVMWLAVAKVFLFDAGGLGDLYRVLSYLGLGVSLLVLGWLYQRFVFRERGAGAGERATTS